MTTATDRYAALTPTTEAIDAWRAQERKPHKAGDPIYGADIRTKAGSWRCVSGRAEYTNGSLGYWTIRAEGKSSAGRETAIHEREIVAARGWVVS